jgi:hypothetical protein
MLDHFFSLMILIFVVGIIVDLAGSVFFELRARVLVNVGSALGLGVLLGFAFNDVGSLPGAMGGVLVFICLYALMAAQQLSAPTAPRPRAANQIATNEVDRAYYVLGLEPGASIDVILRRYKRLVMAWHPDRFPTESGKKEAEEELKKINNAKTTLTQR